ncbi:MAG TPA: iron ABC transporter ATP-binding protein, partial [Naasia sp.]
MRKSGRRYAAPPAPVRLRAAAMVGVAVVALLAGCTSNPVQPVPRSATPGDAGAEPPVTDPSPPAPVPTLSDPITIPVDVACDQLVTPEQLNAYNANLAVDPAYAPSPGAAQILEWQGVACGWADSTDAASVEIAVAHLSPP